MRSVSTPRIQELSHPANLDPLIRIDVTRELINDGLLGGARRVVEIHDHRDGPLVVLDHQLQEEAIEVPVAGGFQLWC